MGFGLSDIAGGVSANRSKPNIYGCNYTSAKVYMCTNPKKITILVFFRPYRFNSPPDSYVYICMHLNDLLISKSMTCQDFTLAVNPGGKTAIRIHY